MKKCVKVLREEAPYFRVIRILSINLWQVALGEIVQKVESLIWEPFEENKLDDGVFRRCESMATDMCMQQQHHQAAEQ